jgi:hypothetical protein
LYQLVAVDKLLAKIHGRFISDATKQQPQCFENLPFVFGIILRELRIPMESTGPGNSTCEKRVQSPSLGLLLLYLYIYIYVLSLNDVNVNHHFNGSWLPACKLLGLRIHRSPQLEALVACPWQWCFNGV